MAGNIRDGTERDGTVLTCLARKKLKAGRDCKIMKNIVGWTGRDGGCEKFLRDGTIKYNDLLSSWFSWQDGTVNKYYHDGSGRHVLFRWTGWEFFHDGTGRYMIFFVTGRDSTFFQTYIRQGDGSSGGRRGHLFRSFSFPLQEPQNNPVWGTNYLELELISPRNGIAVRKRLSELSAAWVRARSHQPRRGWQLCGYHALHVFFAGCRRKLREVCCGAGGCGCGCCWW